MALTHGTLRCRKEGKCECGPCRAASTAYDSRRYRLRAYGRWQPYTDAEPVRDHVRALQDYGIGLQRIAKLAGLPTGTISRLMYGDPKRGTPPSRGVRHTTAEAILGVCPSLDLLGATIQVDATGTRRRIQALVVMGWSMSKIAIRIGAAPTNIGKTMRSATVYAATARAVRDVYDELWDQAPPEDTHRDRIAASRARSYARNNGWVSPLAWDEDIDDPSARPRGVRRDDAEEAA